MRRVLARDIVFNKEEEKLVEELSSSFVNKFTQGIGGSLKIFSMVPGIDQMPLGFLFPELKIQVLGNIQTVKKEQYQVLFQIEMGKGEASSPDPFYRFLENAATAVNDKVGKGMITLFLSPITTIKDAYENSKEMQTAIKMILSHEVSHMKDVITKREENAHKNMSTDNGRSPAQKRQQMFKDYVNSPSELKARIKEIIVQIQNMRPKNSNMSIVDLFWRVPLKKRNSIVNDILGSSPTWTSNSDMFNEDSRRAIMKSIYQYFNDNKPSESIPPV